MRAGLIAVALLVATPAAASECREDVEERLAVLAVTFDDQVTYLQAWSWTWGSIYTAGAATQFIIAGTMNAQNPARTDMLVGAVSAAVGSLTFWVLPQRFIIPLKRARATWDDKDRCALLARAEAVRAKVEKEQALGKSWVGHMGNLFVNVGLSLILGLGYGHWEAAMISGFVGTGIGELNLFTQPALLGRAAPGTRVGVVPIVTRDFSGAGLAGAF
jgi:4-amino-4-deoxy-L-arabinose transferase-like glycosyltransferase